MLNVATNHEEISTKPAITLPSRTLVLAARCNRLAALARESIETAPDADALVFASECLSKISALCSEVAS